jgi:hypothetical protein
MMRIHFRVFFGAVLLSAASGQSMPPAFEIADGHASAGSTNVQVALREQDLQSQNPTEENPQAQNQPEQQTRKLDNHDNVLDKYLHPVARSPRGDVEMQVVIEVKRLDKHKTARLTAKRVVTKQGSVTYLENGFSGDKATREKLIDPYVMADRRASHANDEKPLDPKRFSLRANGLVEHNGRPAHVFTFTGPDYVSAKTKYLPEIRTSNEGELWLDDETGLRVLQKTRSVTSSSRVPPRRSESVAEYEIRDGVTYLKSYRSASDVLEMRITYSNYSTND